MDVMKKLLPLAGVIAVPVLLAVAGGALTSDDTPPNISNEPAVTDRELPRAPLSDDPRDGADGADGTGGANGDGDATDDPNVGGADDRGADGSGSGSGSGGAPAPAPAPAQPAPNLNYQPAPDYDDDWGDDWDDDYDDDYDDDWDDD